jgi:hypothetical protein
VGVHGHLHFGNQRRKAAGKGAVYERPGTGKADVFPAQVCGKALYQKEVILLVAHHFPAGKIDPAITAPQLIRRMELLCQSHFGLGRMGARIHTAEGTVPGASVGDVPDNGNFPIITFRHDLLLSKGGAG